MMMGLAPPSPTTAPKDGRVYRGYFERSGRSGSMLKAVSWRAERGSWVDLEGHEVGEDWRLSAWTPDEGQR
jgi:hypothetical protein